MKLGTTYSREEVHAIFSPETKFTPQAGSWGMWGIIPIPNRTRDFVFFVTYGQSQGDHHFDEGITSDGVLSWQSQPSQHLQETRIKLFISHEDEIDNIYLFLRKNKKDPYGYLGRLGYITHDPTREKPVWFQWQLLDWDDIPADQQHYYGDFAAKSEQASSPAVSHDIPSDLRFVTPPAKKHKLVTNEHSFRTIKNADYAKRDAANRQLGLSGELKVLTSEKERLSSDGRPDLADKVVHTSVIEGDGAGYDIASFRSDGTPIYIEVKTTRGGAHTDFFISPRELEFSKRNPETYTLIRLFNWQDDLNSAEAFKLEGDLEKQVELTPTNFRVKLK